MLNKPNKPYTAERLFLTWFTNDDIEPNLNNKFFGDKKCYLDYFIYDGKGTQEEPYKVELSRKNF